MDSQIKMSIVSAMKYYNNISLLSGKMKKVIEKSGEIEISFI